MSRPQINLPLRTIEENGPSYRRRLSFSRPAAIPAIECAGSILFKRLCQTTLCLAGLTAGLGADQSGVGPNAISLPKGPGANEGLGESFQPHLNTGTASTALPLNLPPGTAAHKYANPDGLSGETGREFLADPQLHNLYAFAACNPLKSMDADGLEAVWADNLRRNQQFQRALRIVQNSNEGQRMLAALGHERIPAQQATETTRSKGATRKSPPNCKGPTAEVTHASSRFPSPPTSKKRAANTSPTTSWPTPFATSCVTPRFISGRSRARTFQPRKKSISPSDAGLGWTSSSTSMFPPISRPPKAPALKPETTGTMIFRLRSDCA